MDLKIQNTHAMFKQQRVEPKSPEDGVAHVVHSWVPIDCVLTPLRLFHQPQAVPRRRDEEEKGAPEQKQACLESKSHAWLGYIPSYLATIMLPFRTQGIAVLPKAFKAFLHEVPRDIRVHELQSGA